MNDPAPKPCPFCGNMPPYHNIKKGRVCCGTEDCCIAGKWIEIETWNRRPNPETQPARDRGEPDAWLVTERDCTPAGSKVINTYATLKHYEVPSREILSKVPLYRSPVGAVPISALRELEKEWRLLSLTEPHGPLDKGRQWCADRLSAVIRGTKT